MTLFTDRCNPCCPLFGSLAIIIMINPLEYFFGIEGIVALYGNPGLGYNTLLLQLIPGNLFLINQLINLYPNVLGCRENYIKAMLVSRKNKDNLRIDM